jgi:hypothetical protein
MFFFATHRHIGHIELCIIIRYSISYKNKALKNYVSYVPRMFASSSLT